jgi:hypothetical protein
MNRIFQVLAGSIFFASSIFSQEPLSFDLKPDKEGIVSRAQLSIKQQRPDVAIDDLVLDMITMRWAYLNEDPAFQKADQETQIYAIVTFYIKSSLNAQSLIALPEGTRHYKTLEVIVAPDIPTEVAVIRDNSMMTSRPVVK